MRRAPQTVGVLLGAALTDWPWIVTSRREIFRGHPPAALPAMQRVEIAPEFFHGATNSPNPCHGRHVLWVRTRLVVVGPPDLLAGRAPRPDGSTLFCDEGCEYG